MLDLFQVLLLGGLHLQDPGSQHLHPLAPPGPVAQAHLGREELFRRGRLVVAPLLPLLTVHPLGPLLGSLCGHRRLQLLHPVLFVPARVLVVEVDQFCLEGVVLLLGFDDEALIETLLLLGQSDLELALLDCLSLVLAEFV